MKTSKQIAEEAAIQGVLNCYMRETGNYEGSQDAAVAIPLKHQQLKITADVKYWSETQRHLFHFPIQCEQQQGGIPLDYVTFISLITKEWLLENGREDAEDEFMLRAILSARNVKRYVEERETDSGQLESDDFSYIEAEQSLLFGHLLHPVPKSKQGITEEEEGLYSPELKGEFPLHYFSAAPEIIQQDSSMDVPAADILKQELVNRGVEVPEGRVLLPVHPLQAKELLGRESVKELIKSGDLTDLGELGSKFTATSSLRTVYSPHSKWMYKFSVPVKLTNSLRVSKRKELHRGVEISRLLDAGLGKELADLFPGFSILRDPAYITIGNGEAESGFEVVIRENPFFEGNEKGAAVVAGLCQDHAYGGNSRLASIIRKAASAENRTLEEVSLDWFSRYLMITFDPVMWLYETYGLALEAHQQNGVVRLKDGYPEHFYYRDNQGYYYSQSKAHKLKQWLPDLSEKSETICEEKVADERLRYYFFYNHLFGVINAFGTAGLIPESRLLQFLKTRMEEWYASSGKTSKILAGFLSERELPCKANLLTRFHDMDELVGEMAAQSVYTKVPNPIFHSEGSIYDPV